MPATRVRDYTVEAANRTLPLVRRIAEDIVRSWEELSRLSDSMKKFRDGSASHDAIGEEMATIVEKVEAYELELERLHVTEHSCAEGIIDFPTHKEGVVLCWKIGEPTVLHWHTRADNKKRRSVESLPA